MLMLLAAIALADAPEAPSPEKPHFTVLPTPTASFDSDNGFGVGVAIALIEHDGTLPYRFALTSQGNITTRGVSQDYVNVDLVKPFGADIRVNGEIRFSREPNASYFGLGNRSVRPVDESDKRYDTYSQTNPQLRLAFSTPVGRPFRGYLSYVLEHAVISVIPGSFLDQNPAPGVAGGWNAPVILGVALDTRDNEAWPTHGQYDEVAVRAAARFTGSTYGWQGATAIGRFFVEIPGEIVIADRVIVDAMHGDVPFYDLDMIGGQRGVDGLGGAYTLRGYTKDRFLGKQKAVDDLELRRRFRGFVVWKERVDFGAVVFADVGRVWADGLDDGPWWLVHGDAGVGGRVILDDDLVLRLDVGVSREGARFFAAFGQQF